MGDVTEEELAQGAWSTLRSEPMAPIRICLPTDDQVATSTIRALAERNIVQIMDNNYGVPITQRRYKQEVASCVECARWIRVLQDEVIAANEEESGLFERTDEDVSFGTVFTDLEQPLEKLLAWHTEVQRFNTVLADIIRRRNERVEQREVLLRSGDFLAQALLEASPRSVPATTGPGNVEAEMSDLSTGLLSGQDVESQEGTQLQSLSGVVLTMQEENFNRALFRAMRGLVITQFKQIEDKILDPVTEKVVHKSAFTTFFHGTQALQRVMRIADGYGAHLYDVPQGQAERGELIRECEDQYQDQQLRDTAQWAKGKIQMRVGM